MSVIENFAVLSEQEQRKFAEALVKTINSEHTFIDNTTFEIVNVEADDISGGLMIEVSHEPLIEVKREATWYCDSEEQAEADPGYDADYHEVLTTDAAKAFKVRSAELDGYAVTLHIEEAEAEEFIEAEVDELTHEDAGIGDYEYWGFAGNDSQPYVAVEGTIVQACSCNLAFFVEAAVAAEEPSTEE